ncbi:carbamoyltransferase N-terminal domain-containing protein [Aliivibrio sp. S2MY1]|uniref:carbamoyltransferase N-terminal domain-containing protein n=1 Tax=Aliivibrio sp. S2MY1 TaxID=3028423 RepID=UPI00403D68C4
MKRRIIGVHSGHDASACLLVDNEIVCAISKERLNRIQHDSGDPIEYILSKLSLEASDIDLVVRSNWGLNALSC